MPNKKKLNDDEKAKIRALLEEDENDEDGADGSDATEQEQPQMVVFHGTVEEFFHTFGPTRTAHVEQTSSAESSSESGENTSDDTTEPAHPEPKPKPRSRYFRQ